MTGIYSLSFHDHTGTKVALVKNWEYFEFTQRLNSPYNHVLRITTSPDIVDNAGILDLYRKTLERDFILQAIRTDAYGNEDVVYEGFNRTLVDQIKKDGTVVFTLYGTGYTNLLKRRLVLPDAGLEESAKTGAAETVIKQYVDEAAVTPVDILREFSGLRIQGDTGAGINISYSARYENLYTVVEKCSEQGDMDFGVVRVSSQRVGEFEFQCRSLWGKDRRINNLDGNTPLIFSVERGNMEIPILSKNSTDELTVAYVAGHGQGVDRAVSTITKPAATDSPWNRIEVFIDARQTTTAAERLTAAGLKLSEGEYKPKLTFNIKEIPNSEWLRDFALGDRVTALYGGVEFGKEIQQVSVIVSSSESGSAQQEVISFEMEDVGVIT